MTEKATAPIYISAAIQERAAPPAHGSPAPAGPRVLHVIASTEAEDSHESIMVQNWDLKRFNENPVVLWAHRRDELPIGTAKAKLVGAKGDPGRRLEADVTFPPEGEFPRSDEIWKAWEAGLLRAVSVGFRAHTIRWEKIKDREVLVFDDLELLELSFVPVGSNPETLADARQRALAERASSGVRVDPPTINVTPGTDPAAVERALIERLAAPVQGVTVPPAESTPAATAAALARQPAAEAAPPQEHRMDPKSLARDLGLPEDATENQIRTAATAALTDRQSLLDALGVSTVDAARGVIEAGRAASGELPKAQARIAELEKTAEDAERASIVAKLEAEKRLTPPLREFVATCSVETLRAFAKAAPVVVAESQHHEAEPGAAAAPAAPVTLDGKRSYEHLTGPERIALRDSDRATFDALRNDWLSRGQPISNTAG